MRMLAFYGKGGIGKSTVVSNLSVLFAKAGKRVLQCGCDPKADSCFSVVNGEIITVMERWLALGEKDISLEHCLMRSAYGFDAIEVGGPQPGTGCAGRGITKAFELVGDPDSLRKRYDVILFDVLGDVVCGGFSQPMRARYADEVYIVTSGEFRALYAANNISQAVKQYARNGVRLGGLIANLRGHDNELDRVEDLAELINTGTIHAVPRDQAVVKAELRRKPVVDAYPDSLAAHSFVELYKRMEELDSTKLTVPRPLSTTEFNDRFLVGI